MIDIEGCVKQWLEEETVSERLEALLLAIEDECRSSMDRGYSALTNVMNNQVDAWKAFERTKAEKSLAA